QEATPAPPGPPGPRPPGPPGPPAPPAAPALEIKPIDQVRLEKFLQCRFDRRESAVLLALHGPPEPPPKDPPLGELIRRALGNRWFTKNDLNAREVDIELAQLRRDVSRGDWARVKAWLAELKPESGAKAHEHLLTMLLMPHMVQPEQPKPWMALAMQMGLLAPPQPLDPRRSEQNVLTPEDVLALADASPAPLNVEAVEKLGLMLRMALSRGNLMEPLVERLKAGTERLGGADPAKRNAAVRLLIAAQRMAECGLLLPTIEAAEAAGEGETLNLLAKHHLAMRDKDKEKQTEHLERAWTATQAILGLKDVEKAVREEALERALRLVSDVREALGKAWVQESFEKRPDLGIEILTASGSLSSKNRHKDVIERLALLRLQSLAAESLLKRDAAKADEWAGALNVFVLSWLREAEATRTAVAQLIWQSWDYDEWGNVYWVGNRGPRKVMPAHIIAPADVLETRPGDAWMKIVEASLRPKIDIIVAQLYIKGGEEAKAFENIERIAPTHPREARELAHEFLTAWTTSHDPNADRRRTNRYMYIYGYNPRTDGIPLSRSQQIRNLDELASWIKRLRALPLKEDLDESLVVNAFTTSHSMSEVFRAEDLDRVFGSLDTLKPASVAQLVQTIRANLAGLWRRPEIQQQKQTKRKDKEIQAEIVRGYAMAQEILGQAMGRHADHWQLTLALAALSFDENNYHSEIDKTPEFAERRDAAFAAFKRAADLYAKAVPTLPETDHKSEVYEIWFYASLGAADLASLKTDQPDDPKQQELIKSHILGLPGETAEKHMGRFAVAFQTRVQAVKPELKHRYLKAGLSIVGDHKTARDAKKVFDYYGDIVREIRLTSRVDGPTVVGSGKPFGVFVDIRHTKEIERESGGFSKYLQNQNSSGGWYWNFGRPPLDYRDRFEETARAALKDRFEVISVVFHSDKIESRGDPEPGWRVTPYAYLLLKTKGPEVDAIPPLRIDLDFMDTSGFAVLPIESAKIPIDASAASPRRPMEKLKIVQTLDERKLAEGKLTLEVRAGAHGLVPDLGDLLDFNAGGFEIAKTEDPGVSVASMDAESERNAAISERIWTLDMKAKPDAPRQKSFRFGGTRIEGAEMVYQRYVDADLSSVARDVELDYAIGRARPPWKWIVAAAVVLAGLAAGLVAWRRRHRPVAIQSAYRLPADVNPFSVLTLLRKMKAEAPLPPDAAGDLDSSIAEVEQHYFKPGNGTQVDLKQVAEKWVSRFGNGAPRVR
ncbi:MAG TPA: hypothetical protein VFS19_02860, partial [Planctomycetota bacterium]|nr:hypothetical protein [Planctomycetota bacterium]